MKNSNLNFKKKLSNLLIFIFASVILLIPLQSCSATDDGKTGDTEDTGDNENTNESGNENGQSIIPPYEVPAKDDGVSAKNTGLAIASQNDGALNSIEDFIGANHINVPYSLSDENCLIDGARTLRELGSKTIKVYLELYYKNRYTANMQWSNNAIESAIDLAREHYFTELFDMDFDTFVIGAYIWSDVWGNPAVYWRDQFPDEAREKEYRDIYELTYYLCKTYAGSGKTFILQNGEGDWASKSDTDPSIDPPNDVFQRCIEWTNNRQDAVMAARAVAARDGYGGVNVYHALEVNLIAKAMNGSPCLTNNVIPYTYCDFYAYSSYDTLMMTPEAYGDALDYLRQKADSNRTGGKSGLYIGEAGYPEVIYGTNEVKTRLSPSIDVAREKGYAHYLYWSVYDEPPAMGYWLRKPDGTRSIMWNELYKRLHSGADDPLYLDTLEKNKASWPLTFGYDENGGAQSNGIEAKPLWLDGEFTVAAKDGVWCAKTNFDADSNQSNIYFNISDEMRDSADGNIDITVTYLDEGAGPFGITYLTAGNEVHYDNIILTGTNAWKSQTFTVDITSVVKFHAGFADFRIYGTGGNIYISGLVVSKP